MVQEELQTFVADCVQQMDLLLHEMERNQERPYAATLPELITSIGSGQISNCDCQGVEAAPAREDEGPVDADGKSSISDAPIAEKSITDKGSGLLCTGLNDLPMDGTGRILPQGTTTHIFLKPKELIGALDVVDSDTQGGGILVFLDPDKGGASEEPLFLLDTVGVETLGEANGIDIDLVNRLGTLEGEEGVPDCGGHGGVTILVGDPLGSSDCMRDGESSPIKAEHNQARLKKAQGDEQSLERKQSWEKMNSATDRVGEIQMMTKLPFGSNIKSPSPLADLKTQKLKLNTDNTRTNMRVKFHSQMSLVDLQMKLSQDYKEKEVYENLRERMKQKLEGWKMKLLSFAGRTTLVNSVVATMPVYAISTNKIPLSVS
ncbi:hypothetical protein G4B88_003417 [Cannabis sativa]|uniref:Uncharacterized protein n=1 Tax=Cannabis sativa TaxID=3483 RepID=A0A7J6H3Y0_CANSA|nr:hypothetical protein G4B88_003417 [Cannabis sativa]